MTNLDKKSKNLYKKGAFGIFLKKITKSNDLKILKFVRYFQTECNLNKLIYNYLTNFKNLKIKEKIKDKKFKRVAKILNKKIKIKKIEEINKLNKMCNIALNRNLKEDSFFKPDKNKDCNQSRLNINDSIYNVNNTKNGNESNVNNSKFEKVLCFEKVFDNNNIDKNVKFMGLNKVIIDNTKRSLNSNLKKKNIILNYYLFRNMDDSVKKKYSNLFYKRFDIKIPENFNKESLVSTKTIKIRKNAFILWLGNYLKSLDSEALKKPSFDIALEAGNLWNEMSFEEKINWDVLSKRYNKKFIF